MARREMGTRASSPYLNLKHCFHHCLPPSFISQAWLGISCTSGAFQAWYPNIPLPFLLICCGERGSKHRAMCASKEEERHELWLTLLPRNTGMRLWMLPELCLNGIWRRWQVPDYPVGWLSLYKQDDSGKGISWFLEPLPCSAQAGVVWQNMQASVLRLDRHCGNSHRLQLRQLWDLFSISVSLGNLGITLCGPYCPWPNNMTVGKNLGCHLRHCSLTPYHTS